MPPPSASKFISNQSKFAKEAMSARTMKMDTRKPAPQTNAPNYDGFKPCSEWKEDEEAKILLIYVPGFRKEDLRVMSVHASRTLQVTGQQALGNNFDQLFSVPDDCDVNKIHAKIQNGTLSIILPKNVLEAAPKEEVQTPQEGARTPLKKMSPGVPESQKKDDNGTASFRDPEMVTPRAKSQKSQASETPRERTSSTTDEGKRAEEKDRSQGNGVIDEVKKPERKVSQEVKEPAMMGENSKEEDFIAAKMKDIRNVAAQTKHAMQNLAEELIHEDCCRKLMMVNVGATVMAISAIGAAYVFSNLRS